MATEVKDKSEQILIKGHPQRIANRIEKLISKYKEKVAGRHTSTAGLHKPEMNVDHDTYIIRSYSTHGIFHDCWIDVKVQPMHNGKSLVSFRHCGDLDPLVKVVINALIGYALKALKDSNLNLNTEFAVAEKVERDEATAVEVEMPRKPTQGSGQLAAQVRHYVMELKSKAYELGVSSEAVWLEVGKNLNSVLELDEKSISQYLKRLRIKAGLSQEKAAASIGKSQSYISYLESGRKKPSLHMLELYRKNLGGKFIGILDGLSDNDDYQTQ